ncbi:unnamed protein product [Staurois parvus]|uniref:TFIIS central domain-containing protein n=1 Tax=Staurois parvus TaxID=386267 RepID=A0ABN9ECC1_9NEOB|nr:unnamed protein product [Staurois parvus]
MGLRTLPLDGAAEDPLYSFFSSAKKPESPKTPTTPKMTRFPPLPVTSDSVRTKCREMLTAALQTDGDHIAIGSDCELLAAQIEEIVYGEVQNTDMKYKNRIRSPKPNRQFERLKESRFKKECAVRRYHPEADCCHDL